MAFAQWHKCKAFLPIYAKHWTRTDIETLTYSLASYQLTMSTYSRTNIFLPSTRMPPTASPQRLICGALTKTGHLMQPILQNTGPVHHPMVFWFWCLTQVAPQPLVLLRGVRFRNWRIRHTRWRISGQELVWDAWRGELRGVWQPMILRGFW